MQTCWPSRHGVWGPIVYLADCVLAARTQLQRRPMTCLGLLQARNLASTLYVLINLHEHVLGLGLALTLALALALALALGLGLTLARAMPTLTLGLVRHHNIEAVARARPRWHLATIHTPGQSTRRSG